MSPPQPISDLEKQESDSLAVETEPNSPILAPASSDSSSQEKEKEEAVQSPNSNYRRQPSTTFAPAPQPRYTGAGDDDPAQPPAPSRTFSRRQMSESDQHHIFGGDSSTKKTEMDLERFQSQKGKDHVIVHWEGEDDPEDPHNWSVAYRWYLTGLAGFLVLNSTFTSSSPSGVLVQMEQEFGFGSEVATLTIAIFVAGYCLGPLVWGPLSERVGRYPVFVGAMLCYTGFNLGCALSQNTASILVFRFLAGTFGASPLTNSGGVIADIWDAKRRGIAMSIFSIAPFAGPAVGPIVGGAIEVTGTSWRWLFYTCTIFSGVCLIATALTLKETYAPIILTKKAKRIRKETGDNRYVSPLELSPLDPKHLIAQTLGKPFVMLGQEIILLSLTVYMSFIYGVVYLLFEAYPVVFIEIHGFNSLQEGLMFIPFFLGGVAAVLIYIFVINPIYSKKVDKSLREGKGGRVAPEERLHVVMIAAPAIVISFFWFAWTSYRSVSFWAPMMAGSLLGLGILYCFLGLFNYIIDCYLANAASALSANTVCRSLAGAGFPLFASQMYARLGAQWASSLLGFIALLLMPLPFIFYRYGPKIRSLSKHAASH